MKNALTLAGIESATSQFVAKHLNHCATAVLRFGKGLPENKAQHETLLRRKM